MTAQEPITSPQPAKLKLTVGDFLVLADAGVFEKYARSELLEGEIWVVNAVHRRHAKAHAELSGQLWAALKRSALPLELYTTPSTELSADSLPEPDIAIAEPAETSVLPGATVRIAIEISDTTLAVDLGRKAELYARYGVPEYWVVDLEGRVLHQMWDPAGDSFAQRHQHAFGEQVASQAVEALAIETSAL